VSSEKVRRYDEELRTGQVERIPGALPPHWPTCFGCGPEAEAGLHAVTRKVGDEVHCTYTFTSRHEGAPGIAHGGAVAALVDDVCGGLLFVIREPAVTRTLNVEYLKPVLVGETYDLVAKVDRREGRKLFITCEGRDGAGTLVLRGGGLFLVVDLSHFDAATRTAEDPPLAL
jgi:acyl-coenzyme A thioesterase PaaI-like protein